MCDERLNIRSQPDGDGGYGSMAGDDYMAKSTAAEDNGYVEQNLYAERKSHPSYVHQRYDEERPSPRTPSAVLMAAGVDFVNNAQRQRLTAANLRRQADFAVEEAVRLEAHSAVLFAAAKKLAE